MLHKQAKNCVFVTGSQHFSPGDIQFQLVYDKGQCAESSYLNPIQAGVFWNHIGWGVHCAPSVSPLFVVQLQLGMMVLWDKISQKP